MNNNISLSKKTANALLNMIGPGKMYSANDKLPNENELANLLKVSRSTLREAIRMLVAGGVLDIKRGLGTFVSDNPSPDYSQLEAFTSSIASTYDAYELRLMFEPKCAFIAAQRATDPELEEILTYGHALIEDLKTGSHGIKHDEDFHSCIARATHNAFISDLMPIILNSIHQSIKILENDRSFLATTLADTQLIIDFLKERNADGAKAAMELHLIHAMSHLDR